MAYSTSSIKNKRGALMICKGGKWIASTLAWMTNGKIPTLGEVKNMIDGTKPAKTKTQPINAQAWPEHEAVMAFVVCALKTGQDAGQSMVAGSQFETVCTAYARIIGVSDKGMESMFLSGYVEKVKKNFPHGVPVCRASGFVVHESYKKPIVRVIGVGLIG